MEARSSKIELGQAKETSESILNNMPEALRKEAMNKQMNKSFGTMIAHDAPRRRKMHTRHTLLQSVNCIDSTKTGSQQYILSFFWIPLLPNNGIKVLKGIN